jgi:DNA-binding winged helix-turn-helix (wHTH) protein/Tol biopolymer transport system component
MSLLINHFYRFGDFTLDTDQRVLLRDGKPLALTPKVFDTLLILVENSGRIVEKEDLMRRLWPDTFVEESNLTFNIQQLRKSLSDDARNPRYVGTVARRGYRFIADVEEVLSDRSQASGQTARPFQTSDAQSPNAEDRLINQIGAQNSKPDIRSANENPASRLEMHFAVAPAADTDWKNVSKRQLALAAAVVVAVAVVGIVSWIFLSGSIGNPGEGKRVDGKLPSALPFKLEKLTATGQSRQVAISPDGKHIAYTRYVEKKSSIWLRQLATSTNVEIVPGADRISGLAFANSGESLYFVRGDPTALYRVSLFGGVPTKIVDKLEGNFSVSADDRQIAIIRRAINHSGQDEISLIIADSDGTAERTLLVGLYPNELDVPLWSPDGGGIICAYGSSVGGGQDVSIVEVSIADGARKELSPDRFFRIAKMAWLPHKSVLIMAARKNSGDNNQLWRVSYPGMEISRITEELSPYLDLSVASNADTAVASQATRASDIWVGPSREPKNLKKITQAIDTCWTPNGRIVYSSTASGNRDLWIMRPDGTEQRQLTVNAAVNGEPRVTPDNRYIVFTSNRTGAFQVWRMNMDGANQIPLTTGVAKAHPAISRDGKWVLYNTVDDWHLWKASIEGGEPLPLTSYVASMPSASPDGKMIACVGRSESKHQLLILPVDGGQPLKRIDYSGNSLSGTRLEWTLDGKAVIYAVRPGRPTAIVRQSLDGGPPEEAASFEQDELFDFGYSTDGQFLAVTRGGWQHDIVLISDLQAAMKSR